MVKKALIEHLDMDPRVTLGVLCDQVTPPEELMDEEEQGIRDRLRSLVLSFLTGEAKRAVERHALPGSAAEDVLITCLLEVSYHHFLPFFDHHNVTGDSKINTRRRRGSC